MGVFKSGWTEAKVARDTAGSERKVNNHQNSRANDQKSFFNEFGG